ncbi:MAG: tRNA (adenosine(37)-N6)-dimethylallyltransferase MiaA [Desulfovibrionaceae bacterium]|nr:tRNA (adenosine(37)-N6)-dimethylallyltransferase MiaA [Desulfovibrionaceae bacterium]
MDVLHQPLPVICLAGPTGAGKTAAALLLAQELNGEVINADSRQVYADFPLITAQPSPEERAVCPHHLYGFLPTQEKISAGQWAEAALPCIRDILSRGRTALLVGGTGLYFQTLLRGIAQIPRLDAAISRRLEARLQREGAPAMHAELARRDPPYAARIHPNDRQRIVRALEVLEGTGRTFSWWHENAMGPPPCQGPLLVLDAPLSWLEPRLARRLEQMLADGALDEARQALDRCADENAPGWSGIGAAEALACLRGRIPLDECLRLWLLHTRAYAKRQLTWFRARKEAILLPPDRPAAVLARAREHGCKK